MATSSPLAIPSVSHPINQTPTAQVLVGPKSEKPQQTEVSAARTLAGRTVKLIANVGVWTAKGLAHATAVSAQALFKAVTLVAKAFAKGVMAVHEAYRDHKSHQAAMREVRAVSGVSGRPAQRASGQAQEPARAAAPRSDREAHARKLDQETRDIQLRLNLLKLPDVPTHEPSVAKPR